MSQSTSNKSIITVSQLNRLARSILESEIGQIWLSAEISNFVAASSGHWYFTLKDNRAQVKAAMFRGANMRVKLRPKEGDKILVRATVGIYEARGDYQLVVDFMEPEGEGQLKQEFERLKLKLAAEGLFATSHKQAMPSIVNTIGVVTSATGAALHDILTVLKRRNPSTQVIVYPTLVQGDTAPKAICQAIDSAVARNEVDVLIIGRGGGSLEDLWCFNDEQVARKVFACPLPTVSAVGHEVDVTIIDFVADLRAPTPSAAAELISNDQVDTLRHLNQVKQRLMQAMSQYVKRDQHRWQMNLQKLKPLHPANRIRQQQQYLDSLSQTLTERMTSRLNQALQNARSLRHRLSQTSPQRRISVEQQESVRRLADLQKAMHTKLEKCRSRLATGAQLLDTVSPLATLSRGYSITFKDQEIVKDAQSLAVGDEIVTQLHNGKITSRVVD